ncbi:MAG: tetratricopeptide repeat protein [Proteobacteria bacterium]|nr:tetratricopeptide repeat protein [Pseudomonadota bacterium]
MADETGKPGSSRDRAAPQARTTKALTAALEHHRAGRLKEAEAIYRRVLEVQPRHADALHLLGVAAHHAGRPAEAVDLIGKAIAAGGRVAVYHNNMGEAYRAQDKFDEAVLHYRQALAIQPNSVGTCYNLGAALMAQGQAEAAIAAYRQALTIEPNAPEAHYNLACALRQRGAVEEAIGSYERALELNPDLVEAHFNLAGALTERHRREEAIVHLRQVIARQPENAEAHYRLGQALAALDRFEDAAACHRQALKIDPDRAEFHYDLGLCLKQQGRPEEAVKRFKRARALQPTLAEAHVSIGVHLQGQGRFEEAAECHRRAIALKPELGVAHYYLALMAPAKNAGTSAQEIERIEAILERADVPAEERAHLHFALAETHHNQGAYDKAFTHYRLANELKAKTLAHHRLANGLKGRELKFDAEGFSAYVDRLIATFGHAFFEQKRAVGSDSELPVFIVGMARSGTTLVEQIIASHGQAFGAGERDDIDRIVKALPAALGTDTPYPGCAALIDRDSAHRLVKDYLARLRGLSAKALRITDKMPNNFLRLGMIALLLPKARIIHCRRDPLDTCLSCYFQNFTRPISYAHDLESLGLYHRQYERLMDHWRGVLKVPMIELWYEDLVADQEGVTRRIVDFLGLEWNDACLAFHKHDRPIDTASFWQARQPVYRSSVGRWRHYEKYLDPLKQALALN